VLVFIVAYTFAKNNYFVMEDRYNRNRLHVSEREQSSIKDYKICLGGAGIGSIISECY